jgi:hypothetical protein
MVVVALALGQTLVVAVVKAKGRVVVETVVGDQGKVGGGSLRGRMPVAKVVHPPKGAKQRLDVWRVGTAEDSGECSDARGEVHSQYGESDRLEIASSTHALGDDTPAIDTNNDSDNSDSETGSSEHS